MELVLNKMQLALGALYVVNVGGGRAVKIVEQVWAIQVDIRGIIV